MSSFVDLSHKRQMVVWSFYTPHWFVCLVQKWHLFWSEGVMVQELHLFWSEGVIVMHADAEGRIP
jgi:hypothetical protein